MDAPENAKTAEHFTTRRSSGTKNLDGKKQGVASPKSQVIRYAQRVLDAAEDFTTRRQWFWLTFQIIGVKSRLGLEIHR
jgi:hypothetical protein